MTPTESQEELGDLTEIYDALRHDAKSIVRDLRGGVVMWREAAAANLAAAGFLAIIALTSFQSWHPDGLTEVAGIIIAQVVLALVLVGFAVFGFRKYFQLKRKYTDLFERAEKLD